MPTGQGQGSPAHLHDAVHAHHARLRQLEGVAAARGEHEAALLHHRSVGSARAHERHAARQALLLGGGGLEDQDAGGLVVSDARRQLCHLSRHLGRHAGGRRHALAVGDALQRRGNLRGASSVHQCVLGVSDITPGSPGPHTRSCIAALPDNSTGPPALDSLRHRAGRA